MTVRDLDVAHVTDGIAALLAEGSVPDRGGAGTPVVFLEIGQDVHLAGGDLRAAVNEGIRRGTADGNLPSGIVADPVFERLQTGDNTPAMLRVRIVPGDRVTVMLDLTVAGYENMSRLAMLNPSEGAGGVQSFVVRVVEESSRNGCPAGIVGVGVGGNFEGVAVMAKRALLRPAGQSHADARWAALERELLDACSSIDTAPGGVPGILAVHIEAGATHTASLPVAVSIQCHAHTRRVVI